MDLQTQKASKEGGRGDEETKLLSENVQVTENARPLAVEKEVVVEMISHTTKPLIYKVSEVPPVSLLLLFAMQVRFKTFGLHT